MQSYRQCVLSSEYYISYKHTPPMQHSYLRNIYAFLQACKKHFNLQDLFVESDLYEVDNFKKVMQVLSRLSHSPEALGLGWV